jgi:hypothetical protein
VSDTPPGGTPDLWPSSSTLIVLALAAVAIVALVKFK